MVFRQYESKIIVHPCKLETTLTESIFFSQTMLYEGRYVGRLVVSQIAHSMELKKNFAETFSQICLIIFERFHIICLDINDVVIFTLTHKRNDRSCKYPVLRILNKR